MPGAFVYAGLARRAAGSPRAVARAGLARRAAGSPRAVARTRLARARLARARLMAWPRAADHSRPDLAQAGIGDGYHGFTLKVRAADLEGTGELLVAAPGGDSGPTGGRLTIRFMAAEGTKTAG